MPLIDDVLRVCNGLPRDWVALFEAHGLNLRQPSAQDLQTELLEKDLKVDRQILGFADFASDTARAIVPSRPAYSLLYHALASPNVTTGANGKMLSVFPTWEQIETVENYVFGVRPPSLSELAERAGGGALSVVVFAYEYRPASQTCHHKHADLTFSRTGIARIGTRAARYAPSLRGFVAESDGDPFAFHVLPARYAAFLAVRAKGDASKFRPMRFRSQRKNDPHDWVPDDQREFWVPLHKLFPGSECLRDDQNRAVNLALEFSSEHVNEKIFRLHKLLDLNPPATPPFRVTQGLAEVVASPRGSATIVPVPHVTLVEEAALPDGTLVTFPVPNTLGGGSGNADFKTLSTSLGCNRTDAPAYVHVRTEIRDGQAIDLNQDDPALKDDQAFRAKINQGGYQALNYTDCTAEGWIQVAATAPDNGLAGVGGPQAAYSLVAAPDFYPRCDQRELTEWTGSSSVPKDLQQQIWNRTPDTLCDVRQSPNLQLTGNPFVPEETITILVSLLSSQPNGADVASPAAPRHSHLPDDGAGLFAPGWDVSTDTLNGTPHLAGYALGSPFPEDAKLCAALSTFWPAVAPDATREMMPLVGNQSGTVSPMTDAEIGVQGGLPWDGVMGPQVVGEGADRSVEFANFDRVDYVRNMLNGKFTMRLTARVDAQEYQNRVLAMALMYRALHQERTGQPMHADELKNERRNWVLLSFRAVTQGDAELSQAQRDAGLILPGDVYRAMVFANAAPDPAPDFRKKRVALKSVLLLLCDPLNQRVLLRGEPESQWRRG